MLSSFDPPPIPFSKCPMRTRRNRSATRIRGRHQEPAHHEERDATISTTVSTIRKKLRHHKS